MKLKYEFETVELDGEYMAVPVGDNASELHAMLRLNETASAILELLKAETTEEAVIDGVCARYEGEREEIAAAVREYVRQLRDAGLLA